MYRSLKLAASNHFGKALLVWLLILWATLLPHQPTESSAVLLWWHLLCAISLFNILAWRVSAGLLPRHDDASENDSAQRLQLMLSAVFVLGCAFRSLLPRADVERLGLFDTWLSSVLVGRAVATIAELCFVAQWALWLRCRSTDAGCDVGLFVSRLIVPLIVVAEVCSWYAILTTHYLGHVIEESIWALSALSLVIGCVALRRRCRGQGRIFVSAVALCGFVYFFYLCAVDVPMYASRWLADEAEGRTYLSLWEGLADVGSRWTVTHEWAHWSREAGWMTLYFSVGVWSSLAVLHQCRFARPVSCRPSASA